MTDEAIEKPIITIRSMLMLASPTSEDLNDFPLSVEACHIISINAIMIPPTIMPKNKAAL